MVAMGAEAMWQQVPKVWRVGLLTTAVLSVASALYLVSMRGDLMSIDLANGLSAVLWCF